MATFTEQRPDAWLDIVGEQAYEATLHEVMADGPTSTRQVVLLPEPTNAWDPNAVAAHIVLPPSRLALVGYLSRENAVSYGAVLGAFHLDGFATEAHITMPWDGPDGKHPMPFAVKVRLGSPGELLAELWLDKDDIRPGHKWQGKTVAFTGPSGFAIRGVHLDRLGMEYLADAAGVAVHPRVTKSIDLCVTSRPDHETTNLRKAAGYGVPILAERTFWSDLGLTLDDWEVGP